MSKPKKRKKKKVKSLSADVRVKSSLNAHLRELPLPANVITSMASQIIALLRGGKWDFAELARLTFDLRREMDRIYPCLVSTDRTPTAKLLRCIEDLSCVKPQDVKPDTAKYYARRLARALRRIDWREFGQRVPLSKNAEIVYDILAALPPHKALIVPQILDEVCNKTGKSWDEKELYDRVFPQLRAWGLQSKRRIGFWIEKKKSVDMSR